jgi:hypothetical protein
MKALSCNSIWSAMGRTASKYLHQVVLNFVEPIESGKDCYRRDRIYREMADTDVTQIGL